MRSSLEHVGTGQNARALDLHLPILLELSGKSPQFDLSEQPRKVAR